MTNEEIFNKNTRLAYKIANGYLINYSREYEDIKQIALLGLWRAVLNYNGISKFSSFAGTVIHNEINRYLQHINKNKSISLSQKINEETILEDIIPDKSNDIEHIEQKILLKNLKNKVKLTKRESEIYENTLKGYNQTKIGKQLNISHQRVSQAQQAIISKFREKAIV